MSNALGNFSSTDLACIIEQNGTECCLSWAEWPEMELGRNDYMAWTLTDIPFPFFNNVFNPQIPRSIVEEVIDETVAKFRQRNVPMFWWTGPATQPHDLGEHLLANGFSHGFQAPAMAIDLHDMNETVEIPEGLATKEVATEEDLREWCGVMTPAYEFPDFAKDPWFEMLAHLGLGHDKTYQHYLARHDGKAVATASIYFSAGVAGVSSVAVHPDHRRKGIGTAITLTTLQTARDTGIRVGVLFSSPMGESVYKRIGFNEYGKGNCYIWSPDGEEPA